MSSPLPNWGNVVGVASDGWSLKSAIDELGYLGFSASQVGIATHQDTVLQIQVMGDSDSRTTDHPGMTRRLLLISRHFPEIDSAILAGTLAANLSNYPDSNLAGLLTYMGVLGEEASRYERDFRKGTSLVTVNAGRRAAIAGLVLQRINAMS
ncbi:hypothetical protein [Schlesneria sp. DSM 10557]|uniref:hypothetical protein n=1 Tax=Schlesneria sp. DSM 10557 TaxID=3044399 RepID=UPI0035A0490C